MDDDDAYDNITYRYPREYLSQILEGAFPDSAGGVVLGADRWAHFDEASAHADDLGNPDAGWHDVYFRVRGEDDHMADDTGRWIDRDMLQDAVDVILGTDVQDWTPEHMAQVRVAVSDVHRAQIAEAVTSGRVLDPDVADLVVQAAVFGRIRHAVGWRPDLEPPAIDLA